MPIGPPPFLENIPINHQAEFRFRLLSNASRVVAEFVVSANDLTKLAHALQTLRARGGLLPSGKPSLRIVTDDGETSS